jgi:hypothetical protein
MIDRIKCVPRLEMNYALRRDTISELLGMKHMRIRSVNSSWQTQRDERNICFRREITMYLFFNTYAVQKVVSFF